jgi:hypothetical protein
MEAQGYATKLKGESKMERNGQLKIKREGVKKINL